MGVDDYFLYAAAAYFGLNAAVFTCAPAIPSTDSFGEQEAKTCERRLRTPEPSSFSTL